MSPHLFITYQQVASITLNYGAHDFIHLGLFTRCSPKITDGIWHLLLRGRACGTVSVLFTTASLRKSSQS